MDHPPTLFGFHDREWDTDDSDGADHQSWLIRKPDLMRTLQYCLRANNMPPLADADFPSDAELERGATVSFVWLANMFSRTALQMLQATNSQPPVCVGVGVGVGGRVVMDHGSVQC
jgi:hypothetical protein